MAAQASQSEVPGLRHNLPLCVFNSLAGQPLHKRGRVWCLGTPTLCFLKFLLCYALIPKTKPIMLIVLYPLPYSSKIWRGIKFGGLAVYYYNCQIKIRQHFLLAYIHMAIPYRTAKFKSANILSIAILGSTAKFNARQYFRLYGMLLIPLTD